jgi:hypothetical protein
VGPPKRYYKGKSCGSGEKKGKVEQRVWVWGKAGCGARSRDRKEGKYESRENGEARPNGKNGKFDLKSQISPRSFKF